MVSPSAGSGVGAGSVSSVLTVRAGTVTLQALAFRALSSASMPSHAAGTSVNGFGMMEPPHGATIAHRTVWHSRMSAYGTASLSASSERANGLSIFARYMVITGTIKRHHVWDVGIDV